MGVCKNGLSSTCGKDESELLQLMNILYIGSAGPLSLIPLQALIKSRHNVCAIAFYDELNSEFNVANSGSVQLLALNNSSDS